MLLTLVAFVFVLGVLIFVHELGHFLAAKAVGIGVPRFSIGFGPATPLTFTRGETEYRVAWIPLGGYVKMASREEAEALEELEGGEVAVDYPPDKLFENKSLFARILVISAGVLMNAVFAWLVYSGVTAVYGRSEDPTTRIAQVRESELPDAAHAMAGLPHGTQIIRINGDTMQSLNAIQGAILDLTSERLRIDFSGGIDPAIIEIPGTDATARIALWNALVPMWDAKLNAVLPGNPAAAAGLERGDQVLSIDGTVVRSWDEMVGLIEPNPGVELEMTVARGDSTLAFLVVPAEETETDPVSGESRQVGKIGVNGPLLEPLRVRFGVLASLVEGARLTADDANKVLFTLRGMVLGRISPRELGGPIFIGQVSGQFAAAGMLPLLIFMAFLSVNLAILNLLPIPVLDGGHLVFLFLEGIRGKPLSLAVRMRLTQIGLFVLLGIMVLALTNDVLRVFGG